MLQPIIDGIIAGIEGSLQEPEVPFWIKGRKDHLLDFLGDLASLKGDDEARLRYRELELEALRELAAREPEESFYMKKIGWALDDLAKDQLVSPDEQLDYARQAQAAWLSAYQLDPSDPVGIGYLCRARVRFVRQAATQRMRFDATEEHLQTLRYSTEYIETYLDRTDQSHEFCRRDVLKAITGEYLPSDTSELENLLERSMAVARQALDTNPSNDRMLSAYRIDLEQAAVLAGKNGKVSDANDLWREVLRVERQRMQVSGEGYRTWQIDNYQEAIWQGLAELGDRDQIIRFYNEEFAYCDSVASLFDNKPRPIEKQARCFSELAEMSQGFANLGISTSASVMAENLASSLSAEDAQ